MTCYRVSLAQSHAVVILGEEMHSGSTDRAKTGQERSPDGYGFSLVSSLSHSLALFSLSFQPLSPILTRACG
jgi:hypothetical protein